MYSPAPFSLLFIQSQADHHLFSLVFLHVLLRGAELVLKLRLELSGGEVGSSLGERGY